MPDLLLWKCRWLTIAGFSFPTLFAELASRLSALTSSSDDTLVQLAHPCLHPLLYVLEQLRTTSTPVDDASFQVLLRCLERLRDAPILAVRKMIAAILLDFAHETPAWNNITSANAADIAVHMLHIHVKEALAEPDAEHRASKLRPAVLTTCDVGHCILDAARPLSSQAVWLSTASLLISQHAASTIPAALIDRISASLSWTIASTAPSYEYFSQERAILLCTLLWSGDTQLTWTAPTWQATLATRESYAAVMDVLEAVLRNKPDVDASAVLSQLVVWLKTTDLGLIDNQLSATRCLSLLSVALDLSHLTPEQLDAQWLSNVALTTPPNTRLYESTIALAGSVVATWSPSAFQHWLVTVEQWSHWEQDPAPRQAALTGLHNAIRQDMTGLAAASRISILTMVLQHLFAEEAELRLLACTAVAEYLCCGPQLNTMLAVQLVRHLVNEVVAFPAVHIQLWTYFDCILSAFQTISSVRGSTVFSTDAVS
jgi:hypothetical protein